VVSGEKDSYRGNKDVTGRDPADVIRAEAAEAALAILQRSYDSCSRDLDAMYVRAERLRAALADANQRADDYADTLRAIADGDYDGAASAVRDFARAALDRHTTPAPTDQPLEWPRCPHPGCVRPFGHFDNHRYETAPFEGGDVT
jgi:hypothetical protein